MSNVVFAVTTGKDHAIWLGTENGVTRFKDGRFTSYKFGECPALKPFLHFTKIAAAIYWSARAAGLHIIRNDSTFTLPAEGNAICSFTNAPTAKSFWEQGKIICLQ
jgi:hypothetical protein